MMFNIKLFKTHKPRAINIIGRCSSITIEYMSCLMSVLKSTHNHIALNYRCPYIIVCVRFRQHPPRQSQNANTWTTHNVQYKLSKTCKPRAIDKFWPRSPIAAEHMSCLMLVLGSTHNRIALDYRCPYIILCIWLRQHPPRQRQNANTWPTLDEVSMA